MRIISGTHKGRRFEAPTSLPVRPTTDLAKESLFNILQSRLDFDDMEVLDLFAGIGSISFEFISRGATKVTAVDQHHACVDFIRKQAVLFGMQGLHVLKQDVLLLLKQKLFLSSFDLIFADPPYQMENIADLPQQILDTHWLKPEGILILEHGKDYDFSKIPTFIEERTYGKVHFSFFQA